MLEPNVIMLVSGLGFQVEDEKPTIDQIHAYENICIAMAIEALCICDITLTILLIEKLA